MSSRRAFALVGALGLTTTLSGQPSTSALVDPSHLRLQPEAAEGAFGNDVQLTVFGDPAKPGLYAIRRRFKPGEMSRPHYHDKERLVTVIKGTWYTGEGDVFDPAKGIRNSQIPNPKSQFPTPKSQSQELAAATGVERK
jgi:hypothetical protein